MSTPIQYLDFEVNIDRVGSDEYRVRINSLGGRADAQFIDPFSQDKRQVYRQTLTTAALRSSARVRSSSTTEVKTMKDLGTTLFDQAIHDNIKEFYYECLGKAQQQGKGLRMRLVVDPALNDLPWEFLCTPQKEFLALDPRTPIVRFIELPATVDPLKAELPLRVLIVIASPKDMVPLDTDTEQKRIVAALAPLQEKGLVQVSVIEGPDTWPRMIDALRPNETNILHFIGHGTFDEKTHEGLLAMEGEDGNARLVGSDRLRILLQGKDHLRLAVLNSCLGAQASESEPLSSVAAAMVQAGVPAVIAMQFEVSDKAAEIIAGTFYQSLALNFPVDAAITEARRQIALLESDSLEWATPVLFMQVPDGQLFDISTRLPEELQAKAAAGAGGAIPAGTNSTQAKSALRKPAAGGTSGSNPAIDLSARAEEAYRTGEMAEMRGDWEDAIKGYQGALYLVPNYRDAAQKLAYCERRNDCVQLYGKAQTQYAEKQYAQVLETLKQLRAMDPRWVDSADLEILSECGLVYEKAIAALQAGDRAKGAELFRGIISKRPDFEDVVHRLDNLAAGGDGLFGMHTAPQYGPSRSTQAKSITGGQGSLQGGEDAYSEDQSLPTGTPPPSKGERVYIVSGFEQEPLAEELRQYFLRAGHETQVIAQGSAVLVQGKKGGWRSFVGMSQAATVMVEATEKGFKASVGGGKWIEQGAAIAVSMFVLWPLLITGGVGMAQQKMMMDELWRIIENYAVQHGGRRIA